MNKSFRERLRGGELLLGTLITLPSPEITEVMVDAGFDWLFIDTEHGAFDARGAQSLLQAAGHCPCLVRVACAEEVWLKKALDIGPAGVIVPQVNSAEQARRILQWCKYSPVGVRGVGIARAHRYGSRFHEYMAEANEQIAIVLQAEHIEAVRNIASIVAVRGVDAIFVGPYDLSASMGKPGQVGDPAVRQAIATVRKICLDAGIRLGVFGVDAKAVSDFIDQGFTLIAVGADALFANKAAKDTLAQLKR